MAKRSLKDRLLDPMGLSGCFILIGLAWSWVPNKVLVIGVGLVALVMAVITLERLSIYREEWNRLRDAVKQLPVTLTHDTTSWRCSKRPTGTPGTSAEMCPGCEVLRQVGTPTGGGDRV